MVVQGNYAYIGHMDPPNGTSIVDVSDPAHPKLVASIPLDNPYSHTHKVRVVGNLMITNSEMMNRHHLRKGFEIPTVVSTFEKTHKRQPTNGEVAQALGVKEADLPKLRETEARGYHEGGFKVHDISDPTHPRLIHFQKTHGVGVHRFDMDAHYAYISTEKEGYHGNVLAVYDLSDPAKPGEVSTWAMPGQHLAGGETPHWKGYRNRLHHTLRHGDRIYAACWHAGFAIIDAKDITRLKTLAFHNYHPPVLEPTHTIIRVPQPVAGRELALVVDEEHDHTPGQPHASLWVFDVTDLKNIQALSSFHVSELDSPYSRAGGRFGAHQFQEHIEGTLAFTTWFGGGLRVVDFSNPMLPKETGHFIPEPGTGHKIPQSNDVEVDGKGLVYLLDRLNGLDILEYNG